MPSEISNNITRSLYRVLNVHPEKYRSQTKLCSRSLSPNPMPNAQIRSHSVDLSNVHSITCTKCGSSSPDEKIDVLLDQSTTLPIIECTYEPMLNTYTPDVDEIITINVSGMRFQTKESTLRRFPETLLGNPFKRRRYWNAKNEEYFLDRHRSSFESILNIYQSGGSVVRPEPIPIEFFLRELKFYQFGDDIMDGFWANEGYEKPIAQIMPDNPFQRRVWNLIEYPDSSLAARILAFISILSIIASVVSFCLETIPELKPDFEDSEEKRSQWTNPFFIVEFCCCVWFSIELILRFASCPDKWKFMKSFLNILDFVAVAPFFINFIWSDEKSTSSSMSFSVLRIIRLVRVFRIFKLSRHSVGLQVLGKTFRASFQEFCLLLFFMVIALVLFSSGVYFAEQNEPNSKFTSIPASFWFVLATMTTVGYGDLVPTGTYGKVVGSCCALIGVLTLALPVPIIVSNFKHFYRQECRLATIYKLNAQDCPPPEYSGYENSNGYADPNSKSYNNVNVVAS